MKKEIQEALEDYKSAVILNEQIGSDYTIYNLKAKEELYRQLLREHKELYDNKYYADYKDIVNSIQERKTKEDINKFIEEVGA